MNTFIDPFRGIMEQQVWSVYRPANAMGANVPAFALGIAHANTGGQDASGTLPIIAGDSVAAGTLGVVFDGTLNTAFDSIVDVLVSRNLDEVLRTKTAFLQEGAYQRATHVKGTKHFKYAFFADLGVAEDLLEGVPPQTVGLEFDVRTFTGTQKGKIVAITDVAEEMAPFELYSVAAEKIAWNAVDTMEKDIKELVEAATGVTAPGPQASTAENVIQAVVTLREAEVPTFEDGFYHALISPSDAAVLMSDTGNLGWTETLKYTNVGPLLNGEIGMFRGVRFVMTTRAADGNTVIHGPDYFTAGDFQTIRTYRVAPGGDHADPLAQRGLVGWKAWWGLDIVEYDGAPDAGPASNDEGRRFLRMDLTLIS